MARKKAAKRASKQIKNRHKRSAFAYPLLIFLLLCAGVFLIAWTLRAEADNIKVTAKVSAPFVTDPAVITSPTDGTHFTSIPIAVSGTCPTNAGYVEIFDNSVMRGTAICDGSGEFNLSIDLFPNANTLVAHVFNITDDEGPVSDPVNVIYDAPQPPPTTSSGPTQRNTGNPTAPLVIKTAFVYKGFKIGDKVEWPVEITGGTLPYAVSVDWGDGNSDLISRTQPGEFTITHVYSHSGGYKNNFPIKVKASDAAGQSAFLQFFVLITPSSIGQAGIISKPTPTIGHALNWLWLAWPVYLLILLMVISYQLGEKEELIILRKKGMLRH